MSTGFTDAATVATINGTASEITTLLGNEGTNGNTVGLDGNFAMTVSSGSATVAQLNTMHAFSTTGAITATITETDIATLDGLSTTSADQLTITVGDTSATAAQLKTVGDATGLNVTATNIATVTGTATQMDALLTDEGSSGDKVNLDGDYNITISGSNASVSQANAYKAATSGVITSSITETDIATLDGLNTASTDQLTITVADTSVTASALKIVGDATGLNVTATNVQTVTGTATQMDALLTDEGSTGDKINLDADYNITIGSGTATVTQANAYGTATDGVVTATISNTAIAELRRSDNS